MLVMDAGGLRGRRPPNGDEPEDFTLARTCKRIGQEMRSGEIYKYMYIYIYINIFERTWMRVVNVCR